MIPILNTLYESRRKWQNNFKFYSGGSESNSSQSSPQATPQQMINLYNQYLPESLGTINSQVQPTTQSMASAAAAANPTYTAGGLSQLNQYAPGYQQAGADLAQQQAGSQNALLTGTGGQLATNAANLSNTLNPAQAASNAQAANLVNSINLNGLSGGETAAVERSLNQSNYATGNLGLDNATNAVSNAMNFGNALQAKRTALGSALNTAQGVASNQNTFVNPVSTALNSGNTTSNFGLSTFNPTQANSTLTTPYTTATGIGNQLAGVSSASSSSGSGSSVQGGLCCFIFLEAYHGTLPYSIRKCRDKYYCSNPKIALGYKRMAKYLVPAMKKFIFIRNIVWKYMVNPLTKYGEFVTRQNKTGFKYKIYRKFWFSVWNILGNI